MASIFRLHEEPRQHHEAKLFDWLIKIWQKGVEHFHNRSGKSVKFSEIWGTQIFSPFLQPVDLFITIHL